MSGSGGLCTKAHWVNTLRIFKYNYVKLFVKISASNNSCCNKIKTRGH